MRRRIGEALLLLALVAVTTYAIIRPRYRDINGGLTMCHSNLKIIGAAIEAYSEDHGRYPTHLNQLSPNYLDTVPTCQEAWDRAYSYEVQFSKQYYWFQCRKHRGWEPEECRRKLARLNEIESAAPSDIGPESQSNKLTCPSGGDPYLYVPHPGVFKLYCQGKNHREVPRDCPQLDAVNGLIYIRTYP